AAPVTACEGEQAGNEKGENREDEPAGHRWVAWTRGNAPGNRLSLRAGGRQSGEGGASVHSPTWRRQPSRARCGCPAPPDCGILALPVKEVNQNEHDPHA